MNNRKKLERIKVTKNELNSSLNIKANIADIMKIFNELLIILDKKQLKMVFNHH